MTKHISTLWFLALLVLTGILFIHTTTNAQTPSLQPTQIITEQDIPKQYNQVFQMEWGGGSLLHLKGRLATMGCIADTIWVYDNNQWHPYNQYQVPHTLDIIQSFKNQYSDYIPPTTIYADCTNICEFNDNRCIPFHEMREQRNNYYDRPLFFIVPLQRRLLHQKLQPQSNRPSSSNSSRQTRRVHRNQTTQRR